CVIAMQTAVQKACFKQWGDSLVMDWTHGTNNLGYHLGLYSLLLFPMYKLTRILMRCYCLSIIC
ncbi:hypothetical protein PHYSODRAFT_484085, partial [Phytophthora sojae]